MKISYINGPLIKLKIMASVATASSDMPGCQAEQLEFLVHWLRFCTVLFPSNASSSPQHESRPSDVHIGEKVPPA